MVVWIKLEIVTSLSSLEAKKLAIIEQFIAAHKCSFQSDMAAAITELFIYAVAVEVGVGVAVVVVQGRQEQAVLLSHAAQLALK